MTRVSLLALSIVGFTGCVDAGPRSGGGSADSTVIVDWTVDGTKDPAQCQQGDAVTMDITVETRSGAMVGEFQADCEEFATSIDLQPGRYQATALLLDDQGNDRTTSVQIEPFDLLEADQIELDVDFPADSFL
jgi:hypothetical protein